MLTFKEDEVKREIESEVGIRPPFALETFTNLEEDVRQSIARIQASPFIPNKTCVRGFVYDVRTGGLNEVPVATGVRWRREFFLGARMPTCTGRPPRADG